MVMGVRELFVRAVRIIACAAVFDPWTDAHVALFECQALRWEIFCWISRGISKCCQGIMSFANILTPGGPVVSKGMYSVARLMSLGRY